MERSKHAIDPIAGRSASCVLWFNDGSVPYQYRVMTAEKTITSNPDTVSRQSTASFKFISNETNSTFTCRLDTGSFVNCKSPQNYNGLASGSHTFQVRATDGAGNTDATPATFTWTVQ